MEEPASTTSTTAAPAQRRLRADARRNYERLVAVAAAAFAEHGAEASLDDIARRAGVGSGTLYRHFPTRQALLEAVYKELVETLCAEGDELAASVPPGEALAAWLRSLLAYGLSKRGLIAVVGGVDKGSELASYCRGRILDTGGTLLARAQAAGTARRDVTVTDVIRLVHAIGTASERAPEDAGQADRLLAVVMDGLRPQAPAGG
jgi:AcrR family transcriptional regulator